MENKSYCHKEERNVLEYIQIKGFLLNNIKNLCLGTGEMTQWLRVAAVLPEDLSSIPCTHRWFTTARNSKFERSDALSWPRWEPAYTRHRHTYS